MVGKPITRTCNLCKQRITGDEQGWIRHGDEHHPNHFLQGFHQNPSAPKFTEKKYWCPLDSKWYTSRKYLARTIKAHGWTNAQYYETYGQQYMLEEWHDNENDKTLGNAHNTDTCLQCQKATPFQDGKWTYPAFCGYACSTKWYAANTNRVDEAMATLAQRKSEDPNHHLRPNQKQYWINKGHTEEEAIALVKERNAVNSLDRYIERAGSVIVGTKNWRIRQIQWQATMDAKPEEEKERIRLLKANGAKSESRSSSYSTISNFLFDDLSQHISDMSYGASEKTIRLPSFFVKPDCIKGNKIIEFFGDYWHGNPSKYDGDDIVAGEKLAKDVWAKDKTRIAEYRQKGFDVLVIWESQYKEDPDGVLNRCITHMSENIYEENTSKTSNKLH